MWLSLEDKLYRVIRSGCDGFVADATGRVGAAGVGVAGSWKDAGAFDQRISKSDTLLDPPNYSQYPMSFRLTLSPK